MHWRTRLSGMSGTAMIFALMLGCAAFRWQRQPIIATASPPLVVTLQPLAAPPEPVEELPEGPRQVERRQQKAQERLLPSPPDILLPRLSPLSSPTHDPVEPAQAVDPIPETMAPKSVPAPPARQASSRQDMTWEAVLLGHLEKYRRYPATARNRREQGVTYVTFHMNRAGMLLSNRIMRSSGSALLDRAALETLKRAQPLPSIPADRSDPLELSVPVEFFIDR
ncbi:energy transducer TonB [Sphingobium yanoikuyae]|uniref:Energy transducer TonB n=2 Tax=Sphingobium yanoikuyae TaxID=13690 RepID=A0A291N8E2_SPHYA|nr:energy transducer TonB [Sphingobium yanoikuyae]